MSERPTSLCQDRGAALTHPTAPSGRTKIVGLVERSSIRKTVTVFGRIRFRTHVHYFRNVHQLFSLCEHLRSGSVGNWTAGFTALYRDR